MSEPTFKRPVSQMYHVHDPVTGEVTQTLTDNGDIKALLEAPDAPESVIVSHYRYVDTTKYTLDRGPRLEDEYVRPWREAKAKAARDIVGRGGSDDEPDEIEDDEDDDA
jgi:hypothetical protein